MDVINEIMCGIGWATVITVFLAVLAIEFFRIFDK